MLLAEGSTDSQNKFAGYAGSRTGSGENHSMRNRSGRTSAMRAAIYLRCSSDDQKEGDFSTLDVQRELNQALIAERG
jgi:hypothetical protein